jgi:hypothetical protein
MIDMWDCSDAWMPTLTTETSQMVHQGNAATEQVRNILSGALKRPQMAPVDVTPQIEENGNGKEIHPF